MAEDENVVEEELDELMEDIEIEEELHKEEKVRKKNAKILLISIIGLLTIAGVYFGINYYNILSEEEQFVNQAESPQPVESGIETLPLQGDIRKIERKESLPPQEEVKKKEEKETLSQKEDIEKKEAALSDRKKKAVTKKAASLKKETNKVEKVDLPEKQIKEKDSKKPQPTKKLRKAPVEKESKPSLPAPQKTAKSLIPETDKTGKYYIQLGLFVIKKNADNLTRSLKNKGFSPLNRSVKDMVNMYRVYAGKFSELKEAREAVIELENAGINAALKTEANNLYTLQTGSFYIKENAEKLKEKISELGLSSQIARVPLLMDVHKVYIGFFKTRKDAALYQQKLVAQGFSQTLILNS